MTQRCRLLARAQISGEVRDPGFEFELADGEVGPSRTIVAAHETIDVLNDSKRIHPPLVDEPLYQVFINGEWVAPVLPGRG